MFYYILLYYIILYHVLLYDIVLCYIPIYVYIYQRESVLEVISISLVRLNIYTPYNLQ